MVHGGSFTAGRRVDLSVPRINFAKTALNSLHGVLVDKAGDLAQGQGPGLRGSCLARPAIWLRRNDSKSKPHRHQIVPTTTRDRKPTAQVIWYWLDELDEPGSNLTVVHFPFCNPMSS